MANIRFDNWSTPERTARQQLDDICRKTGAYVATPDYDTNKFSIWGTAEQADSAEKEVSAWYSHIRATGIRPSGPKWHKEKAFDGRNASRIDQREREAEMALALRNMENDTDFEFVLHHLWPDEPKMPEFIQKYDKPVLEQIRLNVLCRIEFDQGTIPAYRVSAGTETTVKEVSARMNNLIMEMIAQKGDFVRCSRFKLPRANMYRSRVGWDKDPTTGLYLPTIHGEGLPADEVDDWTKLCTSEDAKNRSIIRQSITTCIASLYAPSKHVRMRVTFAELGFAQLQRPPPERDYHTFDEFCQMIPHQNVRISPLGLRSSKGNLSELVDVLDTMPEFGPGETFYTLHFDFDSRNQSTLRLEVEFRIGIMTKELEIFATRWLEFAHNANEYEMLEVNMLDLEHLKCNYQIHIGGTNIFEPDDLKGVGKQMLSFQDKVSYSAPPKGIKAEPRRRAVYPPGNRDLRRVEEIITVRYQFKDTDGVFELQRKDIFDETSHNKSVTPISSVGAGKYYYPEWDSLMGEFANLQPGEAVSWTRALSSFFLDKKAGDHGGNYRALPKGFKTWLKEIEEIQGLLTEGIESVEGFGVNDGR